MQTRDLQYSLTFAKKQALTLHPKLKKMSEKIQPREVETAGFRLKRRAEITVQCIQKAPQTAAKKKKDTPKTTASSVCQHLHRLKQLIRRVLGFWRNSLAVNLSDKEAVVLQILPWDSYVLVLFMNTGCCCDNGTLTSDKTKKEKEKKKILHTADNVFASQPAETVCFSSEFSPHTVRHCVPSYCCCCCWIKVLCWAILLSVDDGHSLAVITVGAQTTAQMQPHLYTTNSLVQQRIATDSLFQAEKIENY